MNPKPALATLCLLAFAGIASAQPVGVIGRLEGRTGSRVSEPPQWPAVGFSAADDPAVRDAIATAESDPWGAIDALGRLHSADARDGQAAYYLALVYERLYERETSAVRERRYDQRVNEFLAAAIQSGDAPWAGWAQTWLTQRRDTTPLERQLLLAGHEVQRGDKGPAVREIQARVGAGVDGDFGPRTEAALKRWQELSDLEPTGRVDAATLAKHQEYTKLGVHWSSGDAWKYGRRLGRIQVVSRDGRLVELNTALALDRMSAAAAADGVDLRVVSGFRTYAQQERLYRLYKQGRGNLAARPGYSNHQDGRAVDLDVNGNVYAWLHSHAAAYDFKRTVSSETWHWEYRP